MIDLLTEDATVTDKGQVTIPKTIRDKMGLDKGSKISFRIRNGEVVLAPKEDEPLEKLRDMREKVSFSDQEIEYMIDESKDKWSKHQ